MVTDRLSADQADAEHAAAEELVRLCSGLSWALGLVTGHGPGPRRPQGLASADSEGPVLSTGGIGACRDSTNVMDVARVLVVVSGGGLARWRMMPLPGDIL